MDVISKRVGNVLYEIRTGNHQLHRRHINQLRKRIIPNQNRETTSINLPLDILMAEWKLPEQRSPLQVLEARPPIPVLTSDISNPPRRRERVYVQLDGSPRRSSRIRRLPRRLQPYQLN